jgi:hypothetical protein
MLYIKLRINGYLSFVVLSETNLFVFLQYDNTHVNFPVRYMLVY